MPKTFQVRPLPRVGAEVPDLVGALDPTLTDLRLAFQGRMPVDDLAFRGPRPWIDVRAYGAGPGINSTTAFQAAADALPNGGRLYIPGNSQSYLITDTITVGSDRVNIFGDGPVATEINFVPTVGGKAAFNFTKPSSALLVQSSIRGLAISSTNTTLQKFGIEAKDVSEFVIEDVAVGSSGPSAFTGALSSGLRLRGRELITVNRCLFQTDIPVSIEDNPNSTIDIDHLHLQDLYLIGTSATANPLVKIASGVNLSNVTFDGYQVWAKGGYGLQWIDTVATLASLNLRVENVRWEQSTNASGYFLDIEHNVNLQDVLVENCYGGNGANHLWVKMRNCRSVTFQNVYYVGTGANAWDFNSTDYALLFENCFSQVGSTLVTTGLTKVLDSGQSGIGGPLSPLVIYDQPAPGIQIGGGAGIKVHLSGTITWDPPSVAVGAQTTTTVTVTGAALGNTVTVGFSLDLQGMQLTGYVSSANTVTVVLQNGTAGALDLGSGTLRADVWQH